jgi:hypothetical protein
MLMQLDRIDPSFAQNRAIGGLHGDNLATMIVKHPGSDIADVAETLNHAPGRLQREIFLAGRFRGHDEHATPGGFSSPETSAQ